MARRTRRASSRSRTTSRSYSGRSRSTSSRGRSYARKTTRRTARRSSAVGRTVRIVIEQAGANPMARPELIGKMPIAGLVRKNKSSF